MATIQLVCPHDHGPLKSLSPATLDGARIAVGGCLTCGGLWVPATAVRSLFPEELLVRFAESGYKSVGPPCRRCSSSPAMQQQVVSGIEVDRCTECSALWLDGGELWSLGGGTEEAESQTTCDVCAHPLPRGGARGALGQLCESCLRADVLEIDSDVVVAWGMGGEAGDRLVRKRVDGADVEVMWDEDKDHLYFQWHAELLRNEVRGSISHENGMSRLLRKMGVRDLEFGMRDFDATFVIRAERKEPMVEWLGQAAVRDALMSLYEQVGITVQLTRDTVVFEGETTVGGVRPEDVEALCEGLFRTLQG